MTKTDENEQECLLDTTTTGQRKPSYNSITYVSKINLLKMCV